jgi:hypothetical protein
LNHGFTFRRVTAIGRRLKPGSEHLNHGFDVLHVIPEFRGFLFVGEDAPADIA